MNHHDMKRICLSFIILFSVFSSRICGQGFSPGPIPDRVILTWSDDVSTTQTVTWRSDLSGEASFLEYSKADAGPDFPEQAQSIQANTSILDVDGVKAFYHNVKMDSLHPGGIYVYRVGREGFWSEWFQFRTAPKQAEPFSFIYFGDAQNNLKSMWSRVIRQAYSEMPQAKFMLHAGDLINRTNKDNEWGEWHYSGGFINAMVPSIPSPGNHEYARDENKELYLDPHWDKTFTLPQNGPEGLRKSVFYIDYGDCRIISLDSQEINLNPESRRKQAQWLREVLGNNPKKWTIITFHHPIFSSKEGRDNKEFREVFKPIFDTFDVDLVLQGHDHTYGRGTNIPQGLNVKDDKAQTVYVVSVSGPKMYNLSTDRWMDRAASNTQLYQIISVEDQKLSFTAFTALGELYDAFEIQKGPGGKTIVNSVPGLKEKTQLPPRYLEQLSKKELEEYHKVYRD